MCDAIGEANVLHMIFKQYHGYDKFGVSKQINGTNFTHSIEINRNNG